MRNYDAVSLLEHDYDGGSEDHDVAEMLARLSLSEAGWY